MSSPTLLARPVLAMWSFAIAGFTWSGLLVANGMLLASEGRFVGNPIYTLAVGVAITATVVGIQLRCYAGQVTDERALRLQAEPTVEIRRPTRYTSRAVPVSAATGELALREAVPTAVGAEVLPSPSTVAAMRRLAAKVTRADR